MSSLLQGVRLPSSRSPAMSLAPDLLQQAKKHPPSRNEEEEVLSGGSNAESAESAVAGMAAPMQALRELLLWPVMYATEAAFLGLRVTPVF